MVRSFFSLLTLVLLACGTSFAGANPAVGQWDCVSDDGHGSVLKWTLLLKEADGNLSGELHEAGATVPLIDPALDGKTLTFKTFINENCTVKYNFKLNGNNLEGSFECPEASGTVKGVKQKPPTGA